jgi:hypothetical protein
MARAGLRGGMTIEALIGGANNQVFRLCAGGRPALLKAYFHHPGDRRNRAETEYRFLTFAWRHGVRRVPQPLAVDLQHHVALYEYVEGRPVTPGELGAELIGQAVDFYHELNAHRRDPDAADLPPASEAHFTPGAHLRGVDERVRRLEKLDDSGDLGREAARFVREELTEAWHDVAASTRDRARRLGLDLGGDLGSGARCLSPSDFGFHNAILEAPDRLRFVDFEYAGWDDPAKLVCDFFCQEAVPVPDAHLEWFTGEIARAMDEPARHRERIGLLLPVYRIKWCCILLNDFFPVAAERRRFAHSADDEGARKARQLEKARRALRRAVAA